VFQEGSHKKTIKKIILTRRETFSASHRLHSQNLSAEENSVLFGKCNSKNGHGHNYVIEVKIAGEVDLKSGVVLDLSLLKSILHEAVLARVDHRHLNLDVPEFAELNPTTENLVLVCAEWLEAKLPAGMLKEVRIWETEKNSAIWSASD
jgi:6-pyruvoyltetrahydropterin/6-carboxytetrahydropterin synthase